MKNNFLQIPKKEKKATLILLFLLGLANVVLIISVIIYFIPIVSTMLGRKSEIYNEWTFNQSEYGITDFFDGDESTFTSCAIDSYYHFYTKKKNYDKSIFVLTFDDIKYVELKEYLLKKNTYDEAISFKYNFYTFVENNKIQADYSKIGNKMKVHNVLFYAFNDKNHTISFYGFYSSRGSHDFIYWREFIDIYFGDDLESLNIH